MLASNNRVSASPRQSAEPEPTSASEDSMSMRQISKSLSAKDPSWFKQTQERGQGSTAYVRTQEGASDSAPVTSNMRLPGMSTEGTAASVSGMSPPPMPESVRSASPSIGGSTQDGSDSGCTSATSSSLRNVRSPFPNSHRHRLDPPSIEKSSASDSETLISGRESAMSPAQGRISPERVDRPPSPTKGLGGFVQSAMMKRSDSVNKRWSAQAGPGLSRGNSTASNASGYTSSRYPVGVITPLSESRSDSMNQGSSPAPSSRPNSSHSNTTITQGPTENSRSGTSTSSTSNASGDRFDERFPNAILEDVETSRPDEAITPATSPSKRWSPSKASWLENAINKPDSPKIKFSAPQQPSWMADISRAKQNRGSVDLGKGSNFKEVSIGGLVRSPPPGAGYKVPGLGGLPSGFSAGVATKPRMGSSDDLDRRSGSPKSDKLRGITQTASLPNAQAPSPRNPQTESTKTAAAPSEAEALSKPSSTELESIQKASAKSSNSAPRPKPETPPKKDFRTNLKARPDSGEAKTKDEPEFKNAFGKLKRTQTQNYKAPDELKDNIMRGKSGLIQTGGPKKTERKDIFKESILQKKQGMVAPSASTRITSASSKVPNQSTPEAITKQKGLGRTDDVVAGNVNMNGSKQKNDQISKPEALTRLQHLRAKPKSMPPENQTMAPVQPEKEASPKDDLGGNFASSLAGILQRGPSPMSAKPRLAPSSDSSPQINSASSAHEEMSATGVVGGPQLSHATKGRAKGPKRRLPTTTSNAKTVDKPNNGQMSRLDCPDKEPKSVTGTNTLKPQTSPLNISKSGSRPLSNITSNGSNNRNVSQPLSPRKPSTSIASAKNIKPSPPVPQAPVMDSKTLPSPINRQKPIAYSDIENSLGVPLPTAQNSQPALLSKPVKKEEETRSKEYSSLQSDPREFSDPQVTEEPQPSVKGAAALWGRSTETMRPSGLRSPIRLPTRHDENPDQRDAGFERQDIPIVGTISPDNKLASTTDSPSQSLPVQGLRSLPVPRQKPASIVSKGVSPMPPSSEASSSKKLKISSPSEAADLFSEIFDTLPSSKQNINVDTQAVLKARASSNDLQKIKTLRKQIFEITDSGRSVPVPAQQEHILFENSIYLCTHVFGTLAGQRTTEVYLWYGDEVTSSAVNDAQIFAKKAAKENNGKLITLKQGKETTNFFQALGGIVITRRGSSSRAESSAPYVLCGRQHVGQIAFDEVDFHPLSLCRGFPYIVSTGSGKLYLWKGSGSGVDELGCARLIGMDLGLTGDIEEVDEGKEPEHFWQCFNGLRSSSTTSNTQHWHLKPSCEKYTNRLFGIDVEIPRPKSSSSFMQWGRRGSAPSNDANAVLTAQTKEILPFAQADLVDDGVFVLDAFFEIFM